MKKGRHRRFEEARKLKQAGPSAADLGFGDSSRTSTNEDDDEYAAIAERYADLFDEDDEDSEDLQDFEDEH
jgi:hypothetical protein